MLAVTLRSAGALRSWALCLAPLLQDGLLEQLQVHVVAHGHHVARLLGAQQVARAADFQIAHGDLEAGAELGKVPDGGQALFGHLA